MTGRKRRKRGREDDDAEDVDREEEVARAVLDHVVGGSMLKELYIEVMDMMIPRWDDDARKG